jgi:hypothetical protein
MAPTTSIKLLRFFTLLLNLTWPPKDAKTGNDVTYGQPDRQLM